MTRYRRRTTSVTAQQFDGTFESIAHALDGRKLTRSGKSTIIDEDDAPMRVDVGDWVVRTAPSLRPTCRLLVLTAEDFIRLYEPAP